MMQKKGFTLIELLVVIAIIALLLAILMPALKKAKNHAMSAVCLSNLKQLSLSMRLYAHSNHGRIPKSDIGAGPPYWWVFPGDTEETIMQGMLWPYVENLELYTCPTGKHGEKRNYSMVGAMNSNEGYAWKGPIIKNLDTLRQPGSRIVFIDEGKMSPYAFMTRHKEPKWRDPPPVRHNNGITLSFADGHSERWKWKNDHTIKFGTGQPGYTVEPPVDQRDDLVRMQKALWGELGYTP